MSIATIPDSDSNNKRILGELNASPMIDVIRCDQCGDVMPPISFCKECRQSMPAADKWRMFFYNRQRVDFCCTQHAIVFLEHRGHEGYSEGPNGELVFPKQEKQS